MTLFTGFVVRSAISMRKEVGIVVLVIAFLLFTPLAAVMAMTDPGALMSDPQASLYTGTASTTNTYEYGYCTFWAAKRREEVGKPIPNTWGDAHTWDERARRDGYIVDHTPVAGAIMETDAGVLGHVAYVESVASDGTWNISEMSVKGWDVLSYRAMPAAQAQIYNFIH